MIQWSTQSCSNVLWASWVSYSLCVSSCGLVLESMDVLSLCLVSISPELHHRDCLFCKAARFSFPGMNRFVLNHKSSRSKVWPLSCWKVWPSVQSYLFVGTTFQIFQSVEVLFWLPSVCIPWSNPLQLARFSTTCLSANDSGVPLQSLLPATADNTVCGAGCLDLFGFVWHSCTTYGFLGRWNRAFAFSLRPIL